MVFGCTEKWAKAFAGSGVEPDTSGTSPPRPFLYTEFAQSMDGFACDHRGHDRLDALGLRVQRVRRRRVLRGRRRRRRRRFLVDPAVRTNPRLSMEVEPVPVP